MILKDKMYFNIYRNFYEDYVVDGKCTVKLFLQNKISDTKMEKIETITLPNLTNDFIVVNFEDENLVDGWYTYNLFLLKNEDYVEVEFGSILKNFKKPDVFNAEKKDKDIFIVE